MLGKTYSKDKKYKLLLLSPKQKYVNYPAHTELSKIFGKKRLMIQLALPLLASLTPDHYEIKIIDEEIEDVPKNYKPDIIGITTLMSTSVRAYMYGDYFRSLGSKVIMGGPQTSYTTEESLKHADSIVIGEAEGAWEKALEDFENHQLKSIYQNEDKCDYKSAKPPRWDLVDINKIFQVGVQVSRGCPYNCDFCLVSKTFGRKMRYRDIDNVVEEIKSLPVKYVFFVDDNLTMNKKYAKELTQRIKPLGISWGCQCSIDVANDEELLKDMAESGCFNILLGFESLNPESLNEANKKHNKGGEIFQEAINKIYKYGIHINASFIVGFDNDTLDEFDNIFNFTVRNNLPNVNLHLLTITPGTELFERMKRENRMLNYSPELGVGHFPTLSYMNMSSIDIFDKYIETVEKLYSFETIYNKAVNLFSEGTFTRPGGDISFLLKMRLTALLIKEFVFTTDPYKKKLFNYLIGLIKQKKIAIDKAFAFMISMLGYHRHIQDHKKHLNEYRNVVNSYNSPPFKESLVNK